MPSYGSTGYPQLNNMVNEPNPDADSKVYLRRKINLHNAVTLLTGTMIGAGIFVSPKGVLQEAGSIGAALVVWMCIGFFLMTGALCFIELGTTFPKSGGHFTYLQKCYGELPAFLYLWKGLVATGPAYVGLISLTFANYVLKPWFPDCPVPQSALRIIAALLISFLTYINCRNVRWVTRVQDIFTYTKIFALLIIIGSGATHLFLGSNHNFDNAFQGTKIDPGSFGLSFYSALVSYSGWFALNFVTEEVVDPLKNLPRAIYISLPLITIIYTLTNAAYFAVLLPDEILASSAVAVTFGERMLGIFSWIMPISVAISTFGVLNGNIFVVGRLFYVVSKEGHLPRFLSMVHVNYNTPTISNVFLCTLSLAYLFTTDVYVLINYISFLDSLFLLMIISGLIWLRYKKPDLERPIKVNILCPIVFLIVSAYLVTFPTYKRPIETGVAFAFMLTGIPVYYIFVHKREKPKFYNKASDSITIFLQKLFLSVPEEKHS